MTNYNKILDDLSKIDKSELVKKYWIDKLYTNLYMEDFFLESFYQLELLWIKAKFEDRWGTMQMKINDIFVLRWYDDKYSDEFIRFLQWLLYSKEHL